MKNNNIFLELRIIHSKITQPKGDETEKNLETEMAFLIAQFTYTGNNEKIGNSMSS